MISSIVDGTLNYLVLSGGFDVSRSDSRRLVDLRSGQYRRFNATYTHNYSLLLARTDLTSSP